MDFANDSSPPQAGVCTAFPRATEAAVRILTEGGNAIDGAVAAAFALSVCEPSASGLGGQTTLLFRAADGETRVIDGHSHAPRLASEETITAGEQQRGRRSCTIPSTPATLAYAHRKYGRSSWAQVLAPARAIAEGGFAVTPLQRKQTEWVKKWLRAERATAEVFLRGGEAPRVGEILCQPRLARTLHRIAEHGADDFYRGELASDIARDMREGGGLLDEHDLESFSGPVERAPLAIAYRGFEVTTVPRPGGGLHLLVALKLLEHLLPEQASGDEWYESVALATYGAFQARELHPQGHVDGALATVLVDEERIARLAQALLCGSLPKDAAAEEPGDTTHLTVADGEGNVVALTQSIQSVFGAKVANGRLGFLYNNYLRTCPRHPHPSRLGPNCSSRSNVSPVLIRDPRKRPLLALGSAGSRRITSSLLQVVSNVIDRGMDVADAVAAPRVHGLLSGKVWIEFPLTSTPLLHRLARHFPKPVFKKAFSFGMGAVHALQFLPGGGTVAAADPRRDGTGAVVPR